MSGLIKGRLYESKEGRIIRLLAFVNRTDDVYVVDCQTRKMTYENIEQFHNYSEISESRMISQTVGFIPDFDLLNRVEQKCVRDRYNLISPLLMDIELPDTHKKLEDISNRYKISINTLKRYLALYSAYARIEALLPRFNRKNRDIKYDCKPKFTFAKYNDAFDQEPNYSVLLQDKLNISIDEKAVYINVLFDSFSRKILSYIITLNCDSADDIKEVFYKCLSSQGVLPHRLNITVNKPTYTSNLRNLNCIGVDIRFSYVSKHNVKEINKVIGQINSECRGIKELELIDKEIGKIVKDYNNQFEAWGLSHNYVYTDIKHIFKDSFVHTTKGILDELFSVRTYKEFFGENNK